MKKTIVVALEKRERYVGPGEAIKMYEWSFGFWFFEVARMIWESQG